MRRLTTNAGSGVLGILLALVAGVLQGVIASAPTNDDFFHLVFGQQWLGGDWPIRDFFDNGLVLMYWLSALAQSIVGYRLLAEAVVVGVAMAVSTYLVFRLVRELTGSTGAAALSAVLLVVAGPRGYSYPKILVYAVAAVLWWAYVRKPRLSSALALGVWTAAAFYWRPDHGIYVAAGVVLAFVAAHGFRPLAIVRCCQAGALAVGLVLPLIVFASATVGLGEYLTSGFAVADAQHNRMNTHPWPTWPVRNAGDVFRMEPAEEYAPTIGIRWSDASPPEARASVVDRYRLTVMSTDGAVVSAQLSAQALLGLRALINEPVVEDTSGVDRSTATLSPENWIAWRRWRYEHWWLRFRVLPGVDEQTQAGEAVAVLFYLLPVMALGLAVMWGRHLRDVPRVPLAAFAAFGVVSCLGLMRTPYSVRAIDGVVLPAILFGCCAAMLWRGGMSLAGARRWLVAGVTVIFVLLVVKSVAAVGEFGDRVTYLAGDWRSLTRVGAVWAGVREQLVAEPPLKYWPEGRGSASLRLARYAHECTPASERILVLWFAPEIYYYADRLMAQRHLFFMGGDERLDQEQRMELAKVQRFAPPITFANQDLNGPHPELSPGLVDYVQRQYEPAGSLEADGQHYTILVRRDRRAVRTYGEDRWPCFV